MLLHGFLCSLLSLGFFSAGLNAQDLVGINWSGDVFHLDSTTGGGSFVAFSGITDMNAMAVTSTGTIYVAGGLGAANQLHALNPQTGQASFVANIGLTSIRGMAMSPSDVLYVVNDEDPPFIGEDYLYTLDPVTGVETLIGTTGVFGMQAMSWHNGQLYGWDCGNGGNGIGLCTIDPNNGSLTDVGAAGGSCGVQALASNGTLFAGQHALNEADTATGELIFIGTGGYNDLRGFEFMDTNCAFFVSGPTPGVAGFQNSVSFQCATPNGQVALAYSFTAGDSPVGVCPGLTVNMGLAQLAGVFSADAAGNGMASSFVSPGLGGRTILYQAVDLAACKKSNLVTYLFP